MLKNFKNHKPNQRKASTFVSACLICFGLNTFAENDQVTVYVNSDRQPSLLVQPIARRTTGNIGFWVGHNSDGEFSNLVIRSQ